MVFSGLTMCDLRRAMFWLLAVLAVAQGAPGSDVIPVPEFSDHEVPLAMPPDPPSGWYEAARTRPRCSWLSRWPPSSPWCAARAAGCFS